MSLRSTLRARLHTQIMPNFKAGLGPLVPQRFYGMRLLSTKRAPGSTISCTTIDANGNIQNMSKKYPKTDFLKKLDLYPRDLRKIDNSSIDIVPTITIRKNCILVNLLHIKSVIMKNQIMIFDTLDPESVKKLSLFIYDLQDKLKTNVNHNTSFEFKALETVLINVMSVLENDLSYHVQNCTAILEELENSIERHKLRDLLIYSKSLSTYSQKASLIRGVLDELLDTDEDLRGMYLSDAIDDVTDVEKDPTEVEFLLENYYNQCDEFVQQANSLISDIRSTEDIVNIILDSNRNSLMLYDLKITIYTLGFTVATTLPAFYGMNLKNFIEDSPYGFATVVGMSVLSAVAITILNFHKLRVTQHSTMMLGNDKAFDGYVKKVFIEAKEQKPAEVEQQKALRPAYKHWTGRQWRFPFRKTHGHVSSRQKALAWRWLVDRK